MNPLTKAAQWISEKIVDLGIKTKFLDYPTVSGGFEAFRGMFWDSNWSQAKQLKAYSKSLYVFACVSKIARKTASINWELYRIKNKAGDKLEIFAHDALDLLYRPNPFQTKTEFYEKYMINKLLAGENFVLKVRAGGPGTKVTELWNLRPDLMRVIIDANDPKLIKGYEFDRSDKKVVFDPNDIIHDAYPSPLDEFGGLSALQSAQVRVDTEEFASKYQSNFFRNNARPDFLVMSDNKINADQKEEIKTGWEKRHKGKENAGRGAFLEGGLKYQQVSITQREMDYIESMKFTRDDILVAFAVPKPIVAITDDVNLANAKTAMDIFLQETIEPEVIRITEKLNEHLIYPEWGDVYFIDYSRDFLPNDEKLQAETDQILIASGVKLINEAREERGMDPLMGGDTLYMPIGMVGVGGRKQTPASAQRDVRARVFRGRGKAIKFLEIEADVKKTMYKALAIDLKEELSKGYVKNIVPADHRQKYADYVNKAIDVKTTRFKPELEKFAKEQMSRVLKEIGKGTTADETKALGGAFDTAEENKILAKLSLPFIQEFVRSAGEDAMSTVAPAEEFTITERVEKYIKERAKQMAKQVNSTTVDKLSATLAAGIAEGEGIQKLRERVEKVYDEFPVYRAETIARTEATAANNRGFIEAYDQSGVANAKEWISTLDSNTRDSHASTDGEIVGLDEQFSNGLDYPGDPGGDPGETINCRCVIAPAFKER